MKSGFHIGRKKLNSIFDDAQGSNTATYKYLQDLQFFASDVPIKQLSHWMGSEKVILGSALQGYSARLPVGFFGGVHSRGILGF